MHKLLKRIITTTSILICLSWFTCGTSVEAQRARQEAEILAKTQDWPTVDKTEDDFREYLDNATQPLNPIEGIWNVNTSGTWRNIMFGTSGPMPDITPYRIAIVRDEVFKDYKNYDFIAIMLESEMSPWRPGRVKALFRTTAYRNAYEALWYMSDYSQDRFNFTMDDLGLITSSSTRYRDNFEVKIATTLMKAYPPLAGSSKIASVQELMTCGSGFLVTESGLVVTNYHVVEDAERIEVVFPEFNVTTIAVVRIKDTQNDIVLLELEGFIYSEIADYAIPYTFADVNSIKLGQETMTLGFPLGDIMGSKSRVSTGRINSLYGIDDDPRLLQISNPMQPGNSGGPLFNAKGECVGIVVSGLNAKYFYENVGVIPQNVNFAIKSTYLQNLILMLPEGDAILHRRNLVVQTNMEDQIEQLTPFVCQIRIGAQR